MADEREQTRATHAYRLLWRWHFYAALFVMPFLMILAITGTLYCFQPQIEPLLYPHRLVVADTGQARLPYAVLLARAEAAAPAGAIPTTVSIDTRRTRSAEFVFRLRTGGSESIYVNPYDGAVLGSLSVEHRIMQQIRIIHRSLLLGKTGEVVMELAGCWTLVMLGTGVALWWPSRSHGLNTRGAILWPRRSAQGRLWWRELHAALGIWLVLGALAFVLTGLPWSSTWGKGFKALVTQAGVGYPINAWAAVTLHSDVDEGNTTAPADERGAHALHGNSNAMPGMVMDDMPIKQVPWAVGLTAVPQEPKAVTEAKGGPAQKVHAARVRIPLDHVIAIAKSKGVVSDYQIVLPVKPSDVFTISYFATDPKQECTIHVDQYDGKILEDLDFHDYGVMAQAVSFGTALHMGRYFGLANQIICSIISLGLFALSASGFWMWMKRRPARRLGAPPRPVVMPPMRAWVTALAILGLVFPFLGLTLITVWFLDRLFLAHIQRAYTAS